MADNAKNKIMLIDGIIQNDGIDTPKAQYKNWELVEFTNSFPQGFSDKKRACYFSVANEIEATEIVNHFRNNCLITDYIGDRQLIRRIYFWHK